MRSEGRAGMVRREILRRVSDPLKHPRVLLSAALLVVGAGCVSPIARFNAWQPGGAPSQTTSEYDWRCDQGPVHRDPVTGEVTGGVFYTNDPGVHDITNIVNDSSMSCVFVTPAQVCAGAPAAIYQSCLVTGTTTPTAVTP